MSDPTLPLQVGMASALLASSAVTDLVGQSVFDELSAQGEPYPLIEIGDDQDLDDSNTCAAADEVWSTVHIYADGPGGRHKAKAIAGAVKGVLLAPFPVEDWVVVSATFHSAPHGTLGDSTDPDGLVAHSQVVVVFRMRPAT